MLNEMMYLKGTSYRIRFDTAMALSKGHTVYMISPTSCPSINSKIISHNENFTEYVSPGVLMSGFRRGGFSILDLFYKVYTIFKFKPQIVYTTTGHRPAQLVPSLIAKRIYRTRLIDERWEYYGVGGRSDERNGFLGRLINLYDFYYELRAVRKFATCITVTERLSKKLASDRTVFFPGVIDTKRHTLYTIETARKSLGLSKHWFIIGALSLGKLDHEDYLPFLKVFREMITANPDIHLFCTGESDYITSELLSLFPDNIIFKGWLPEAELNSYLSSCDMFVLPLNPTERNLCRWPIKFNDYLYFRKPVLINPEHEVAALSVKNPFIVVANNHPEDLRREIAKLVKNPVPPSYQSEDSDYLSFDRKIALLNDLFNGL